jgi:hypothetical protein
MDSIHLLRPNRRLDFQRQNLGCQRKTEPYAMAVCVRTDRVVVKMISDLDLSPNTVSPFSDVFKVNGESGPKNMTRTVIPIEESSKWRTGHMDQHVIRQGEIHNRVSKPSICKAIALP